MGTTTPKSDRKQKPLTEDRGKSENDEEDKKSHTTTSQQHNDNTERKLTRKGSRSSVASSSNGEYRFAQEINETAILKAIKMGWCFLAIILNCILIAFASVSYSGMVVRIPQTELQSFCSILILFLLLLANISTVKALDSGYAALSGYFLATTGGNMNLIGFSHKLSFMKIPFVLQLPVRKGGSRNRLMWVSLLWAVLDICKILIIVGCCYFAVQELRLDGGQINCIVFKQVGSEPFERNWPTFEVQAGIGELVFGSSLGRLRSEENVPESLMILAPMLDGAVEHEDTIVGPGFSVNIKSTCICSDGFDATSLGTAGIASDKVSEFSSAIAANLRENAMINYVTEDPQLKEIYVTSVFLGNSLCGDPKTSSRFPVCKTTYHNHKAVTALMRYMTDGSTASIAQESVILRSTDGDASMYPWGIAAVKSVVGEGVQLYKVPLKKLPGDTEETFHKLNPLDYWTNGQIFAVDTDRFSAGVENLFALVFRAGIQRTYGTDGHTCVKNVQDPKSSLLFTQPKAYSHIMAATVIQLLFAIGSVLAFIPWLGSKQVPVGPAYRALIDHAYFTALLGESETGDCLKDHNNAHTSALLEALDQEEVIIGETIVTKDDDIGHITMGNAENVIPLLNARKYN